MQYNLRACTRVCYGVHSVWCRNTRLHVSFWSESDIIMSLSDIVPIPPGINMGLSSCREDTMLQKFGSPGALTDQCSAVSGTVRPLVRYSVDVGPFKVSGLEYAVNSLAEVFDLVSNSSPETFDAVKTAGMLCVRRIKHNPAHFSNHSWGTAIDLYFGNGVLSQGKSATQRGFLSLFQAFNQCGWYWGAGFSGGSVDSMHFELANETILTRPVDQAASAMLISDNEYIQSMGYDFPYEDV